MRTILTHVSSAIRAVWSAVCRRSRGLVAQPGETHGGDRLRRCLEHFNRPGTRRLEDDVPTDFGQPANLNVLNARARIGREAKADQWQSVLIIETCGTIEAPDDDHDVGLEISLCDVTDGTESALPALNRPKHGPLQGSSHFAYRAGMGRLCHRVTVLEDWTMIAQLSPEWFVLPRQGSRRLQCNVAIISQHSGGRLAAATCTVHFESLELGYLDIEDNIQRAKTLAVGLAFSVGAADNDLSDPEVNVIHGWVRTHFGSADVSPEARLELERALTKTAAFFRKGGRLNVQQLCREIVEIAPLVGRLEILDLCLRVAGAKGQVSAAELTLIKQLAQWLQIERARLRTMAEKILPVHMHTSKDAEMILGVTEDMSTDEARHQLNREYAKWSSRVISSDPAIRRQADLMLNLLATARTQYVGVKLSKQPATKP